MPQQAVQRSGFQRRNQAGIGLAEEKTWADVGMYPERKQAPDGFQMCVNFKWKRETSPS